MATNKINEFLKRNREFAASGSYLPRRVFWDRIPTIRADRSGTIVVTCCDPRLDFKRILGVNNEPIETVWMIQNPGGRAHLALNQIAGVQAVSNPGTIIVIHHNDCGMSHVHDDEIKKKLIEIAPDDRKEIEASEFGEITTALEDTIKHDVHFLRNSSWVPKDVDIFGLKYDMDTGLLEQVIC